MHHCAAGSSSHWPAPPPSSTTNAVKSGVCASPSAARSCKRVPAAPSSTASTTSSSSSSEASASPLSSPVTKKAHATTVPTAGDTGMTPVRCSDRVPKKRSTESGLHEPGFDMDPFGDSSRRQKKLLKLALAKSLIETKFVKAQPLPPAKVFRPTLDEFADPIQYITRIQREAETTGICKIVPPAGWNPPFAIDLDDESNTFETRLQRIHQLQQGLAYGDGRVHNFKSYRAHADAFLQQWSGGRTLTSEEIEQDYWRIVETGETRVEVEYANDLDTTTVGTGFYTTKDPISTRTRGKEEVNFQDPEYYKNTAWNLNNIPDAYGSLLRHVHTSIKGINVPWLYCGMLFASFCWHTEDNYMYSVNYQHLGAKKRWYGIPSAHCKRFDEAVKNHLPERFREEPDLLFHLTTMIPPSVLNANGVDVYTVIQEPGEIILTFPRAYHAGYSEGFNCNEAVNFVLPNWIQYSRECVEKYREVGRLSIFSHDHFIFHFGSTQSLDEYTVDDCEMLLRELRTMFHEEQYYKKAFQAQGLVNIIELSADVMLDDMSMQQDDLRQCFYCRHNIFFSGVTCACSSTRLSCLRHAQLGERRRVAVRDPPGAGKDAVAEGAAADGEFGRASRVEVGAAPPWSDDFIAKARG
ncbi:Histone demethylase, partial [Globisporangium splendens]